MSASKLPTPLSFRLLDWGLVPDPVLRAVCTLRTRNRLKVERCASIDEQSARTRALRERLRKGAVATHTSEANQQHYEVPTEFFSLVLGRRRKYSSCYWPEGVTTLDEAEEAMRMTIEIVTWLYARVQGLHVTSFHGSPRTAERLLTRIGPTVVGVPVVEQVRHA